MKTALSDTASRVGVQEHPSILRSLFGDLRDWFWYIRKPTVLAYTQRKFPECFAQLQPRDRNLMQDFLETDSASNTFSLLKLGGLLTRGSESHSKPGVWLRWLKEAYGEQPPRSGSAAAVYEQPHAPVAPERWFFLNGICTSLELAQQNVRYLNELFARELTMIHNPTEGLAHDLVESALQKFTTINTEPVARAFIEIAGALADDQVDKVVVVAHSQGTIIMGDVLDLIYCSLRTPRFDLTNMDLGEVREFLEASSSAERDRLEALRRTLSEKDPKALLAKLELYLFANCASRMRYLDPGERIPHIESYANTHDIVTRLGSLAPDDYHRDQFIHIDGTLFTRNDYGHLLNAHYLSAFPGGYHILEAAEGTSIGPSVHAAVHGNPAHKNAHYVPGPGEPKLPSYLRRAQAAPAAPMYRKS